MKIYNYEEKGHENEIVLTDEDGVIAATFEPRNFIINYKAKLMMVSGRLDQDNAREILDLIELSQISAESKKHLKNMTVKIVRADYIVREIKMNNMYILQYEEDYHNSMFTAVFVQHNARSRYTSIPVKTPYGTGRLLIQPRDDETKRILNNAVLGLNAAGSLAVSKAGLEGIKWLTTGGLVEAGVGVSLVARLNLYYLATHGTNLVISTACDIYFKSIGYDEGVGKVNPLRDIYGELGEIYGAIWTKAFNESYDEKRWHEKGENLFYKVDLVGALAGLGSTANGIYKSAKYGKNVTYKIHYSKTMGEGLVSGMRKLRKSYIFISGGALARDINPIIGDTKEIIDRRD